MRINLYKSISTIIRNMASSDSASKRLLTGSVEIPPNQRPTCSYGEACYRRNPVHLGEHCHPHLESILLQQRNPDKMELPSNIDAKVDKSLLLDQLKVLQRIYAKLADKTPAKKSRTEAQLSLKESKSSSENTPMKTETKPISYAQKTVSDVSSKKKQNDSPRESIQSTSRFNNNFHNMKQKCKELKRKSVAESEKKYVSPFSSDIASRVAAAAPYYFFLTKVRSEPKTYDEPLSITFRELLDPSLGQLKASLQINFLVELPWVMHHYKHQGVDDKPLLIVHGEDNDDLKNENLPSNIRAVRIKTPHPFGHHHTKMSLFHYEDGSLRVVVSTANLVASDWHNRTQGLWISPACPQLPENADTKAGDSPTEFKTDLLRYLSAYQKPELQSWITTVRYTDFSSIRVCFVASVPGPHRGPDMDRWGHKRLATFLKKHATGVDSSWPVVAQCSSIGSLGTHPEAWMLDELRASMTLGKGTSMIQGLPQFKVIYPSKQNVYDSLDSALGGDCLPYSMRTHTKQTWFTNFLYQWKSGGRFRTHAVPHIKSYTRISPCGNLISWFHLSSANLSKAAWGMNSKSKAHGSGLNIMSYEAGVLFLPQMLINKPLFPLCDNDEKCPPFSLPYDLPLVKYNSSDNPWVTEYLSEFLKNRK